MIDLWDAAEYNVTDVDGNISVFISEDRKRIVFPLFHPNALY